jgi:hypothetical protein
LILASPSMTRREDEMGRETGEWAREGVRRVRIASIHV